MGVSLVLMVKSLFSWMTPEVTIHYVATFMKICHIHFLLIMPFAQKTRLPLQMSVAAVEQWKIQHLQPSRQKFLRMNP